MAHRRRKTLTVPPEYPSSSRRFSHRSFTLLPASRVLGFATFGSRTGQPIIYLHGIPGSRLEAAFLHPAALALDVHLISLDRPGLGLSTPTPTPRTVEDIVPDVIALANHLCLPTFKILAFSGGNPYALACARSELLRERCTGIGIVAGMAPWSMGLAGVGWRARLALNVSAWSASAAWYLMAHIRLDGQENAVEGELWRMRVDNSRESYRQGVDGNVTEVQLLSSDWGFALEDVERQGLWFWVGGRDENAPAWMGKETAKRLRGAVVKEFDKADHVSIRVRHGKKILEGMLKM